MQHWRSMTVALGAVLLALPLACTGGATPADDATGGHAGDHSVGGTPGSGGKGSGGEGPGGVTSKTFYGDVLPVLERSCLGCHQNGGIAPFALENYAAVQARAPQIAEATAARVMPPWGAVADGSCGDFRDSLALSDDEIALIGEWANGELSLGKERAFKIPVEETLEVGLELKTPNFAPVALGTDIAAHDDWRCFPVDAPNDAVKFITGSQVIPGNPEIVHHLILFVVTPDGPSYIDGMTNREVMAELQERGDGRDGWSCFGAAGDGVQVNNAPVVWAPGAGVVQLPDKSGVPLLPGDQLVVQVHYNLAHLQHSDEEPTDQTTVKLAMADQVERVGILTTPDPFLGTLFTGNPDTLEPGKASVKYRWEQSLAELGFAGIPDLKLAGVLPHMHELGHKMELRIHHPGEPSGAAGEGNMSPEVDECGIQVDEWDFHWQRHYFYEESIPMTDEHSFEVTCDFDTSSRTEPVTPGWGTENEMCLMGMYFTAPIEVFQ
jgi:Copper type II ascorbate-dependent monooxygenase, C-terminal domain